MPTDTEKAKEWMRPKEIAAEYDVSVSAIYKAVARGDLVACRPLGPTGSLRIRRSALTIEPREEHR